MAKTDRGESAASRRHEEQASRQRARRLLFGIPPSPVRPASFLCIPTAGSAGVGRPGLRSHGPSEWVETRREQLGGSPSGRSQIFAHTASKGRDPAMREGDVVELRAERDESTVRGVTSNTTIQRPRHRVRDMSEFPEPTNASNSYGKRCDRRTRGASAQCVIPITVYLTFSGEGRGEGASETAGGAPPALETFQRPSEAREEGPRRAPSRRLLGTPAAAARHCRTVNLNVAGRAQRARECAAEVILVQPQLIEIGKPSQFRGNRGGQGRDWVL
jgi:hypothetical protein